MACLDCSFISSWCSLHLLWFHNWRNNYLRFLWLLSRILSCLQIPFKSKIFWFCYWFFLWLFFRFYSLNLFSYWFSGRRFFNFRPGICNDWLSFYIYLLLYNWRPLLFYWRVSLNHWRNSLSIWRLHTSLALETFYNFL